MNNNTNFWLNDVCVLFKHENLLSLDDMYNLNCLKFYPPEKKNKLI